MHKGFQLLRHLKTRQFLFDLVLLVSMLSSLSWLFHTVDERSRERLRSSVANSVNSLRVGIESELDANAYLVNGLVALVNTEPHLEDAKVDLALKTIYEFGKNIRNVGVAPGNRLSYIFPLQGNESALGLYYPDNPQQWPAVQQAIAARTTTLAGPVNLLQGGSGLISRTPVFLNDGSYWGILSMVLDADKVLADAGFQQLAEQDNLQFAIRGSDGKGSSGNMIVGDPALFATDAVMATLHVPGGSWQIAAYPADGWDDGNSPLSPLRLITFLVALIFIMGLMIIQSNQGRIEATERHMRAILDTASEGIMVLDQRGNILEANPAACRLFEMTRKELRKLPINEVLNIGDENNIVRQRFWTTGAVTPQDSEQIWGKKRLGDSFAAELSLGETTMDNLVRYVVSVRDVTFSRHAELQLRRLANTDGLTGINNRRSGLDLGSQALLTAKRYDHPLTVMMIDADHFKLINDAHGHDVGDEVLVKLVEILKQQLRDCDILCRFGGEEFLVIMPETSVGNAALVAKRLLQKIRLAEVALRQGGALRFTVSIGISQHSSAVDESLQSLIKNADIALYNAKTAGRDRYALYEDKVISLTTRKHVPQQMLSS